MSTFEPAMLPDAVKEDLCLDLLSEFGARVTSMSADGELRHCCVMPWHDERRPSASLNYKKLTYKCLGCDSSGGLLWLIGTVRSQTWGQVHEWLGSQTGIGGADFDLAALLKVFDALEAGETRQTVPIPRMSDKAIADWEGVIHPWLTTGIPDVMEGRGIPEVNAKAMRVGYAPEYPVQFDDDGNVTATSHRIVIPHFWNGSLVGWQSRRMVNDDTAKYLSTPDFPREQTLYNHDPSRKWAVVVESPMTCLKHLHHLPMVGTFGASITDKQIRALAEYPRLVIWMDPDPAGWKQFMGWQEDGGEYHPSLAERLGPYSDVYYVASDWAADGADLDDETAAALVEEAVPSALWQMPTALRCLACREYHSGACQGGE